VVNATSLLLFSVTYLIIFGILMGITGQGALVFSLSEIITMMTVSAALAIGAAVVVAAAANLEIWGSGSRAGEFVWRSALFVLIAAWATYFVGKMTGLMPAGTPWEVSALFIGPPIIGLLWGMFVVWHKGSG